MVYRSSKKNKKTKMKKAKRTNVKKLKDEEIKDIKDMYEDDKHFRLIVRSVLLLLLFVSVYYFFVQFIPSVIIHKNPTVSVPSCTPNTVETCIVGSCVGVRECTNESNWGPCVVEHVCVPGDREPCTTIKGGCINGVKTCNDCGTGWGPCIPYR